MCKSVANTVVFFFPLACQLWAGVNAAAFDTVIHTGNFPLLLPLRCFSALDFCI